MLRRQTAIDILAALQPKLNARGIAHVAIFGSVARDLARETSDIDVLVTPAESRKLDLFDLGGVQTLLDENFAGMEVDVAVGPVRTGSLARAIGKDRVDVF
jgi:predicted nucleotidyltransferase